MHEELGDHAFVVLVHPLRRAQHALNAEVAFPTLGPQPVTPRPASTTLVLRDNPAGHLEVLMLRRQAGAKFMPGHYVFPGGAVDEADASEAAWALADEAAAVAEARLGLPEGGGAMRSRRCVNVLRSAGCGWVLRPGRAVMGR